MYYEFRTTRYYNNSCILGSYDVDTFNLAIGSLIVISFSEFIEVQVGPSLSRSIHLSNCYYRTKHATWLYFYFYEG